MSDNEEIVWLVVHYDWEDSDIVAICKTRNEAYTIRKKYLKNRRGDAKNVNVIKRECNKIITMYYKGC